MCLLNRKSHRALGQFIVYNGNVHRFRALPGHAVAKVVLWSSCCGAKSRSGGCVVPTVSFLEVARPPSKF